MFTVCPKCALTLVVTAADLKVAQGYVRCGRCSNVFNAIVGLSEDRAGQQGSGSSSGTSTTITRKAPSISEDALEDPLSDTGETEAIYAEPDPAEGKFQEAFVEPEVFVNRQPPPRSPSSAPGARPPQPASKASAKSSPAPSPAAKPAAAPEQRFDDNSEIPESALEFNPSATDVNKVFVEPAPTRKIDMTGSHERIALKPEEAAAHAPPRPARSATSAAAAARGPARAPERDAEDLQIESELRSLAAKLDATGSRPALKHPPPTDRGTSSAGSPYNSADEPANVALKASKARRPARPEPPTEVAEDIIPEPDDAGDAAEEFSSPPPSQGRRIAWISGIVALGLVLAAQAIHHNRNDLATNARLNRPLTRFYAAIGAPLMPNWNLGSYDVRQLGASTSEGSTGSLTVRASLKNSADQPLPLPLLRITVQDRYGNRIATRDVAPAGYMPGAVPEGAHLGVGQRVDAQMTFKDPGPDAVGFEIDACLPKASGGIACANDASAPR
jgi:predicted Zn finger-like uncharacterized protein